MLSEIKTYRQTGDTCAIVCMLIVLEYYGLIPKINKHYENKYYRIYRSRYMEGTPLSALAWHFSKNNLETIIIHSSKKTFSNEKGLINKDIYDDLMTEYKTFLNQAETMGTKICNGMNIDSNLLITKLNQDYLIILAGQMDNMLHTVLVCDYKDNKFIVCDPLYKEKQLWNKEAIEKFMNTDIGKWCILVKN